MTNVLIRNNKAKVKDVFEYISLSELQNPNEGQKILLDKWCDSIEFYKFTDNTNFDKIMKKGDYLFLADANGNLKLKKFRSK